MGGWFTQGINRKGTQVGGSEWISVSFFFLASLSRALSFTGKEEGGRGRGRGREKTPLRECCRRSISESTPEDPFSRPSGGEPANEGPAAVLAGRGGRRQRGPDWHTPGRATHARPPANKVSTSARAARRPPRPGGPACHRYGRRAQSWGQLTCSSAPGARAVRVVAGVPSLSPAWSPGVRVPPTPAPRGGRTCGESETGDSLVGAEDAPRRGEDAMRTRHAEAEFRFGVRSPPAR